MRNVLKNSLLVIVTVVLCTAAAEGMVRWLEAGADQSARQYLDKIPLAPGVDRGWFTQDPPPLPNRHAVPAEWRALDREIDLSGVSGATRRADAFKAWNSVFVGDPCQHPYLKEAPGRLFVYDPPDGSPRPPYRFLPDATTPNGLVTNAYGFRGPPVPVARQPKTIRIAFVGASTTVSSHNFPYSYPEYVWQWLNQWAAARKLDVRFEVLNAGRESINSTDIAAIMQGEVAPLAPDLVVYYEGANQFNLRSLVPNLPPQPSYAELMEKKQPSTFERTLTDLAYSSALARRLQSLLASREVKKDGGEWAKPEYKLVWPSGLDERDPDLSRTDLPVNLPTILHDLDIVRGVTAGLGGELALSSFVWLVSDGMVLDPERHRGILEYLNVGYSPYRYRDLERLATFQNRVFAKYAVEHKLAFLDVSKWMPRDPSLFIDAIHGTPEGVRLRGWVMLQLLVPLIERHLADGTWPKKDFPPAPAVQPFKPRQITFDCKKKAG
ncbi:MAG: hypothetical protein LCH93_11470 [Proteobacteria bacterium]|nr:hypothetical protein [Pseudomonadota bacterium]